MFKKIIKKSLGIKEKKPSKTEIFAENLQEESGKLIKIIKNFFSHAVDEYHSIIKKCQNLRETNFQLGIKHLKSGNLSDARLRFAIIIKFWPKYHEAYYQKAYVEMLMQKFIDAQKTLSDLEISTSDILDPKFDALRQQIESSIEEILEKEKNHN